MYGILFVGGREGETIYPQNPPTVKKGLNTYPFLFLLFSLFLPDQGALAQCSGGLSQFSACYGDNEADLVLFEICPSAGTAIRATVERGSFGTIDGVDNLTVYEGGSSSGTSGTIYFGPQSGDFAGTLITGSTNQCLIFVSNSNGTVSCTNLVERELIVCAEEVPSGTVDFTGPTEICINAGVQIGLAGGYPRGGTYSGPGVNDNGNGTTYSFDPAIAGVGVHTLSYQGPGGAIATYDIEVFALPGPSFTAPADLCIDAGIQTGLGGGSPSGGVYSGPGVSDDGNGSTYSFNPGVAGLGVHTITYTEGSVCALTAIDNIEVLAACGCPTGQDSYFHCYDNNESDLVIFEVCPSVGSAAQATIDQGVYASFIDNLTVYQGTSGSGSGGTLLYGPASGDLSGTTITGNVADQCLIFVSNTDPLVSCKDGDAVGLEVCGEDISPFVVFTAPDDLCEDAGVQTGLGGGSPTGGVYSGPGVTDDGNGLTYGFDPAAAGTGTQTITYTNGSAASDDVEVFALVVPVYNAPGSICIDEGIQENLGGGFPTGGVYSGLGVSDDGNGLTYRFYPRVVGIGSHTVTYTDGNCGSSDSDQIVVTAACTCPSGEQSFYHCYTDNESDLVIFEVCPSAGEFAQAEITQGTYLSADRLSVYAGATGSGTGGTLVFGPQNGNLAGTIISGTIADQCLIFVSNSDAVLSCATGIQLPLLVCGRSNASNVTFTAPEDLAISAGIQSGLGGGLPTGGVYSGSGVTDDGNGLTYSFDPTVAGLGVQTLTYTVGAFSASDDVEVLNLAPPSFSKSFNPIQTGVGAVSTLTFTIDNASGGAPATSLAFTDNLPAGMTVANPPNLQLSNISGTVTATAGASSISLSDGILPLGITGTISVDVTSSSAGTLANTTGDLTSSNGNSGTASANLIVSTDRPGVSMSFSPSTVNLGERSTLTITIDNATNSGNLIGITMTNNLPAGLEIASPANLSATNTGIGTLTGVAGTQLFSYNTTGFTQEIAANGSCTFSVDVVPSGSGTIVNSTEAITVRNNFFQFFECGKATAALTVNTPTQVFLQKTFSTNPVLPGGTTTLDYTITNLSRDFSATNISFTDDLDAVLTGLVATGTPLSNVCGTGASLSGTSTLTLSGGTLAAGASCTFSVPVTVPGGATTGAYPSTSSAITATSNGAAVTGNTGTAELFVAPVPTFTKTFLQNPIPAGGTATLEFTITNNSTTNTLESVTFTDPIADFLSGATVTNLPAGNSCGTGSTFFTSTVAGELVFQVNGANIAPSGSCTFTIDLAIPDNVPTGTYNNTTSELLGSIGGQTVSALAATDDLEILAIPRLSKAFLNDPVDAGSTVNLEFTLSYDAFATGNATGVAFTDDLNAVIPGLAAVGLPLNDICGTGSSISGTTNLTFTGGTMAPGDVCTFTVPVQVPVGVSPGSYTNTTSSLSATVGGQAATYSPATDDLDIGGLSVTQEFIGDPAIPGELVTLRYTIDNTSTFDATNIVFTENLTSILSSATVEAPPTAACGGSFIASGNTFLILNGAAVTAGSSCSFDLNLRVPSSATSGTYNGVTSTVSATINGSGTTFSAVTDQLVVDKELIQLTKSFTDDPVLPGSNVTLEYTLTNLSSTAALTNVAFTDDLDAVLSGLAATGLPQNDICGTGSQISGTSTVSFSGGNLSPGASCTFSITVQVPGSVAFGSVLSSTTSTVTGTVSSLSVEGTAASDELRIQAIQFDKTITGPVQTGNIASITYTITTSDPSNAVSDLAFTDDLEAWISGLTTVNLPLDDACGLGARASGSSVVTLGRGELAAGTSCNFDVQVQIPCGIAAGTYASPSSTLSGLFGSGSTSATAAATNLTVNAIGTSFTAPSDLCTDDGIQNGLGGGSPSGGVYSGSGVTDDGNGSTYSFDPSAVGEGIFTITYTEATCGEVASDEIVVIAVPTAPSTTGEMIERTDPVVTGLTATVADCIVTPSQSGTTSLTINTSNLASVNFSFGSDNVVNFDMSAAGIPAGAVVKDANLDGLAVSIAAVSGNAFVICSGSDGEDATLAVAGPDNTATAGGDGQNTSPGPWTIAAINTAAFDGESASGVWTFTLSDTYDDPSDCSGAAPENEITSALSLTVEWEVPTVTSTANLTWWNAATGGTQQGTGSPFDPTGTTAEEGAVDVNTVGDYTFYAQSDCSCADTRSSAVLSVTARLPLDLLRFEGYALGQQNQLEWTTANEWNTQHFQVERSADGQRFVALGNRVAAAGIATAQRQYDFLDEKPLSGTNFYRLRMVDLDGSTTYSRVIALTAGDRWESQMRVVPVPASDWASLRMERPKAQLAELRILDVLGAVVRVRPLELRAGANAIDLDVADLAAGVYWLQVTGEGWSDVVRLVVE